MLVLTPLQFEAKARAGVALTCSLTVLAMLVGRQMFEAFEGRSLSLNWQGRRMGFVRWAIITNIAAACTLYLFAVAYEPSVQWHSVVPGVLLVVLIGGAWLLAYQKTIGLLFVAGGSLGSIPAGAYFMLQEAQSLGEAGLFVVLLLPGAVLGCGLLVLFGGPVLRYVFAR